MAIVVQCNPKSSVSFEEFLDYLHAKVDGSNRESLLQASEMLIRLSMNQEFLGKCLLETLRHGLQEGFDRASRIFVLAHGKNCIIRALVWEPLPDGVAGNQFFYEIPHDHDFDFLTVCCTEPGLSSEVFQYDNSSIDGVRGEAVSIERQGLITLRKGVAVFFEAGKDIHIQLPPKSLCVTLNIMGRKRVERSPFWFDVNSGQVIDWVDHTNNVRDLVNKAEDVLAAKSASSDVFLATLESLRFERTE
jgi:hypothetical protein